MKKTAILMSLLIPLFLPGLQAQENSAPPRFTEFRTPEEVNSGGWQNKITDETQIDSRTLQLVTSKDTTDYYNLGICVQVLDKTTRRLLQEIDLTELGCVGNALWSGDYSFDGYDDFSILEGVYANGNTSSVYFLFDPGTGTFFESNIGGTNLEFNDVSKTITSTNYCCAGSSKMEQIYKLVDNRAVLIEQHCLTMVEVEENGTMSYLEDEEGYPVFEEEDCYGDNYIDVELESVGSKDTCRLRLAIYDEDMAGGFVQYKDQKERIPLHLDRSEIIKQGREDTPGTRRLFYNEMYQDDVNGVYVITLRYPTITEIYYLQGKGGKKLMLKEIMQ